MIWPRAPTRSKADVPDGRVDDQYLAAAGTPSVTWRAGGIEEFAVEVSIAKFTGSESWTLCSTRTCRFMAVTATSDYPAERHYRDARVNRIFEGTNEINRLLIASMLMKRALKGELALIPAAKRLMDEVISPAPPSLDSGDGGPLGSESTRRRRLQEGMPVRYRRRDAALRRQTAGRTGSAVVAGRPGHRHVFGGKRCAAGAVGGRVLGRGGVSTRTPRAWSLTDRSPCGSR